jgi:hypothetical protein
MQIKVHRAFRIMNQVLKMNKVKKHTRMKACKFWQDQYLVMAAKLGPSESL